MTTIQHQIDTKTSKYVNTLFQAERSVEDSEQLDVHYLGNLIAYVEVGDDYLNVGELDSSLSTEDVQVIKNLSETFLTEEMQEQETQSSYDAYYAAKNSETINA